MTAEAVIAGLREHALTVACAESLTGGLLCGALTDVPGASAVVRGAVVAYSSEVKASVLGVEADLLAREGAVHAEVARQMAAGVRRLLGADIGVATTGVAGPDPQDGQPVGTVFIGLATAGRLEAHRLALAGTRDGIRRASVVGALGLLDAALMSAGGQHGRVAEDPTAAGR